MRQLVAKYVEAIDVIAARGDATKILAECERIEANIPPDPVDIFYSDKREDVISYKQYVLEIQNDADDFLFSLAGNKGETFDTLKSKTVSDLMSFAERLINEVQKNGRH